MLTLPIQCYFLVQHLNNCEDLLMHDEYFEAVWGE